MTQKQSALSLRDPLMVRNARLESRGHKLWMEILIFLLVFLVVMIAENIITMVPTIVGMIQTPAYQELLESAQNGTFTMESYVESIMEITKQMPSWVTVASLFATAGCIAVALIYCTKMEKRKLSTLGLTRKKGFSEYCIGLGVGLLMFVLVVGLNLLFGGVKLEGIAFQPKMLPILILSFLGYLIQGASEEILCRGYFCVSVSRWMPLWVGMVVNSIAFALLHLANPGLSPLALLNLFLFGIFMTVYMVRRGNLWGVCAIHSIWNFTQGNIFGLQVSGMTSENTVLRTVQNDNMTLWNGGAFGPEGGLCVTFVLIAAILIVWLFCKNRDLGQTADPIPQNSPVQKALPQQG